MSTSEWISVKDRLPETDDTNITHVLGWNGFEAIRVDFYREEGERFRTHCLKCFLEVTDQITHWMPLPEPPKV